jgi:predicted transcriptional regulator
VLSAVLTKVPDLITKFSVGGHFLGSDLLMSVKPKYAERLLSGTKLVEIRRRFSKKWLGRRAVLYASQPQGALVGEATIDSITHGPPDEIWTRFENNIGASWDEFKGYTASAGDVSAIQLSDIRPYRAPVPLDQIEYILQEDLRPPQSYCELNMQKNTPWARAVSIATLLHSRCKMINRSFATTP